MSRTVPFSFAAAVVLTSACAPPEGPVSEVTVQAVRPPASAAPAPSGDPPAPSSTSSTSSTASTATTGSTQAPKASCPPTFAQAYVGGCHLGDAPCSYPEGSCQCDGFPQCGGAMRPPAVPSAPGKLRCTASDAQWIRPDGCTDAIPKEGAPCAKAGQLCSYGDCAWSAVKATCKGGAWRLTQYRGPPPP
jgi:hypothetical protein